MAPYSRGIWGSCVIAKVLISTRGEVGGSRREDGGTGWGGSERRREKEKRKGREEGKEGEKEMEEDGRREDRKEGEEIGDKERDRDSTFPKDALPTSYRPPTS